MGSGCFWGREYHFRQFPGVISTQVGFAGGTTIAPSYQQVCAGGTGHAEVVKVTYDVRELPTRTLLIEFFALHNFTKDRRFGKGQYRSLVLLDPQDPNGLEQEYTALKLLAQLRENGYPPSTELRWEATFFPAADRHQQYCSSRGIVPKKRVAEEIRKILTL